MRARQRPAQALGRGDGGLLDLVGHQIAIVVGAEPKRRPREAHEVPRSYGGLYSKGPSGFPMSCAMAL